MAQASRDENRVATLLGVDSSTFTIPTTAAVNPATHALLVEASFTPSGTQDVNLTKVGGVAVALGQTTMAASIPVTLASNQSTINVTGTGSAGTAATGVITIQGIASMTPVQVSQATGTNLHVVIDSGTITTVSSLGTGTTGPQKAEDSPHASTDAGIFVLSVANEAQSTLAADGDYIAQATDTKGNTIILGNVAAASTDAGAPVKIGAKYNSTKPTYTDGQRGDIQIGTRGSIAATLFTADSTSSPTGVVGNSAPGGAFFMGVSDGTSLRGVLGAANALNSTGTGLPTAQIIGQFDDVSPTSITENQFGNIRMSANRNVYATIRDAAGNERGLNVDASGNIGVTTSNATVDISRVSGNSAAVNNGSATTGTLRMTLADNSTGNIATIGTSVTPGTAAANLGKAEDAAHASGDVGVFALGVRNDTLADVSGSSGDYIQMSTDLKGRVMVGSAPRTLKANQITTITASVSETTIVTAVASTFLDMYGIIISNTSATLANVAIKDSTSGTTRFNISVPANDTRGFMLPIDAAIKQSAVNNNWTATSSASVSSLVITALTVANV